MESRRIALLLPAAVALAIVAIAIVDALAHIFYFWSDASGCETLIVDVYGFISPPSAVDGTCYRVGMSAWELRSLGRTEAKHIIIITHVFSSEEGVGIGVSDEVTPAFPLLHPVTALFSIKGVTGDGRTALALSPGFWIISHRLTGKTVTLITCFRDRTKELVDSFLRLGAEEVIVVNVAHTTRNIATTLVNTLLESPSSVCDLRYVSCYR